jgi:AcrR family transcriptional regulator
MTAVTDEPAGTPLPRVLAIAWGRAEPATRGPRAALGIDAIVATAIALADEEGLEALSMSNLAQRLGYSPMSLYRHVPSKEDLLALVQDAAFGDPPAAPPAAEGWRDGLASWARDVTAAYLAHPWVLDIPIAGPPAMPHQIAWLDRVLTVVATTPLTSVERLSVGVLLGGYARDQAQLARDFARGRARSGLTDEQVYPEYERVLRQLVSPDRFPAVHALVTEGGPTDGEGEEQGPPVEPGGDGHDAEFEFGLQRILDGIAAYIAERGG